ncbi:hypothetical protein Dimus_035142 [Dionaea muscipula]
MLSSTAAGFTALSSLLRKPSSGRFEPNPHKPSLATQSAAGVPPNPLPDQPERKTKPSAQLNRWSRARAIRSGRKIERRTAVVATPPPTQIGETDVAVGDSPVGGGEEDEVETRMGKAIYMVSDGTGWTVEHSVNAALGQFEHCFVDRGCPVNTHLFSGIEDLECLMEIVKQAAIEGVSRTGKTPLSIYLAQKGYKVANVPIVMGVELPSTLFQVDAGKVFGLTINPVVLQTIRKARAKSLGFNEDVRSNYSEMDYVRRELECARKIFAQNPSWPVVEVTGKAIEETAAVVLRLYYDRKQKCSMPRISKLY